ncbi:MAG: cysteine hydrolase [Candidatus Aminicenantes bacterium]|nr:cysteine hydrolase [Candidatus Aminicenantes bacterium]
MLYKLKYHSLFFFLSLFLGIYPLSTASNSTFNPQENTPQTALLLIDIQNFYFPGGRIPLMNPEDASLNARTLLKLFREKKLLVIHIRHNAQSGSEIHENVKPLKTEKVISKNDVNCFKDTELLDYLKEHGVKRLVICGMMTHMCVEAAVRAAHDFGFECLVVQDACATRALKYKDREIPAEAVHYSTLATLSGYYAKVTDTETFLKELLN